jgi:isopentenyl-diphosphate Delta-isomerase
MDKLEIRKTNHIDLAFQSQTDVSQLDSRFHYEPLLSAHPMNGLKPINILGKELRAPLWVSSMTGGTKLAGTINRNLARACNEFGIGMGLGSCRIIMEDDAFFEDFNMRTIIGDHLPLWANLGIAQVEDLVKNNRVERMTLLVEKLQADGLIVHVNPMQEWLQPEGDILKLQPLETIKRLLDKFSYPVIVKEVGQGMGPESLRELLRLPLQAIELGAFGGTNFARLELLRNNKTLRTLYEPVASIGESATDMLGYINEFVSKEAPVCKELILSGGIKTYLDGYYLIKKSTLNSIYGMASTFMKYAREDYSQLRDFVEGQVKGLQIAEAYLTIKENNTGDASR